MKRCILGVLGGIVIAQTAMAGGIVSTIVNAPLSATGTVVGAPEGINVYLQSSLAQGAAFMNPDVIGYGIPAGGVMEIEMAGDYERTFGIPLTQSALMMVTGAPQQGLPGGAVGYAISEGDTENVFLVTPTDAAGLVAETLMSPSPGAASDRVRQRGIKVLHIGFQESAFLNAGSTGRVIVRIKDANGNVVAQGSGSIDFLPQAQPQILPTNFPNATANHNWQQVALNTTLGESEGTLPLTYMLYGKAQATDADGLYTYKDGFNGVGVVSARQLAAAGFNPPATLARFADGLVVQDSNGDGVLDPRVDAIVGGVNIAAPNGATGYELHSIGLSVPTSDIAAKAGKRWGGSMLQLAFTSGDKAGQYRPTVTLLADPADTASADGAAFTYTVIAE